MAGFREAVARIDLLAVQTPGYVWHLPATVAHVNPGDFAGMDNLVLNLSVWTDFASLEAFTYRGAHRRYLTERERWFDPVPGPTFALWWVPAGERPTVEEASRRLAYLRRWGPSVRAFPVLTRFAPDGTPDGPRRRTGRR
ncbi:hypothetical protein GCM10025866_08060 [Naasia aerilata]|uniref:DUF3291 domain-containing protein n=2 Tax=Naasia aerilata TaxID=1162966 RepID=A0ABM8G9M5_9MICO|nr:hypothetical protein GCM10025866_08060 [Naasia aerilata]